MSVNTALIFDSKNKIRPYIQTKSMIFLAHSMTYDWVCSSIIKVTFSALGFLSWRLTFIDADKVEPFFTSTFLSRKKTVCFQCVGLLVGPVPRTILPTAGSWSKKESKYPATEVRQPSFVTVKLNFFSNSVSFRVQVLTSSWGKIEKLVLTVRSW